MRARGLLSRWCRREGHVLRWCVKVDTVNAMGGGKSAVAMRCACGAREEHYVLGEMLTRRIP